MTIATKAGIAVDAELMRNYFKRLVNLFFKILPMRENNEDSLLTYMQSLQVELLGCQGLIPLIQTDSDYLTMLSILQYLIDNPECKVSEVKREVFHAISICNKLHAKFPPEVIA